MDFDKLKNLIKHNGDKFIVLENGEPELVIMSFAEYEKLFRAPDALEEQKSKESRVSQERVEPEPEAEEMTSSAVAESIGLPSRQAGLPVRLEDIRLEDLPI